MENLNFHDRTYFIKMAQTPAGDGVAVLNVETVVHHSLGSDYFANVFIPNGFKVLNKDPYMGTEAVPGYQAFKMNMKRKYRDVLATENFIIAPENPDQNIPPTPILVHFENMKQLLHSDKTYQLSTADHQTQLEGPVRVEMTYPQKLGM